MAGDEMHADLAAINTYSHEVMGLVGEVMKAAGPLADAQSAAARGLARGTPGGVFSGGMMLNGAVANNVAIFGQFMQDVGRGVQAIQNAARVCAIAYQDTDTEAANDFGLVDFAFADPMATRPPGLDNDIGQTLWDKQQRAFSPGIDARDQPDSPMSGTGTDDRTTAVYADGSTRTIRTTIDSADPTGRVLASPDSPVVVATTTVSTAYAADGKVVGSETRVYTSQKNGSWATVENDGTSVITTTVKPDGSQTILTSKTDGKPISTVEVPAQDPAVRNPGPAELAMSRLSSDDRQDAEKILMQQRTIKAHFGHG